MDDVGEGRARRGLGSVPGYMGSTGQKQDRVARTQVAPLWDKLTHGVSVMSQWMSGQGWLTWFWGPSVYGGREGAGKPASGGGDHGAQVQQERGGPRTAPGDRVRGPQSSPHVLQEHSDGAMGPAVPALPAENADQRLRRTKCTPGPGWMPCIHMGVFSGCSLWLFLRPRKLK